MHTLSSHCVQSHAFIYILYIRTVEGISECVWGISANKLHKTHMRWETLAKISNCELDFVIGGTHSTAFRKPLIDIWSVAHTVVMSIKQFRNVSVWFFYLAFSYIVNAMKTPLLLTNFRWDISIRREFRLYINIWAFAFFRPPFHSPTSGGFFSVHSEWVSSWHTNSFTVFGEFFDGTFLLLFTAHFLRQALTENISISHLQFWLVHLRTTAQVYFCGDVGWRPKKNRPKMKCTWCENIHELLDSKQREIRNALATLALHTRRAEWIWWCIAIIIHFVGKRRV